MAELEEDNTQDGMTPEQEAKLLASWNRSRKPNNESGKGPRQAKKKQLENMVDGRSLRETRSAQLNFRTYPEIRDAVRSHCESRNESVTKWLEAAIKARLELEGYSDDA
jgi:predicted HicB family RNase H-like nuclease